jgi:hypothetical protein
LLPVVCTATHVEVLGVVGEQEDGPLRRLGPEVGKMHHGLDLDRALPFAWVHDAVEADGCREPR